MHADAVWTRNFINNRRLYKAGGINKLAGYFCIYAKSIRGHGNTSCTEEEKERQQGGKAWHSKEGHRPLVQFNAKKKESPTKAEIKIKKAGARKTYYTDEQEEFN